MISKKNLILIGMMGAGKSTIGSILAKKLKYEFIDIDQKIEISQRMKISKIFKIRGEKYFREIEEKISKQFLEESQKVIALGGGGFLNNNIRRKILKSHVSFWLNWKSKTILKRVRRNKKRPIIEKLDNDQIKKLIIDRNVIYAKAKNKISCENKTINEIVESIKRIYEKI